MQDSELSGAAVRILTGGVQVPAEQGAAVHGLVREQLGRSVLGDSALARLREQPGEGSASIVGSVIADELRSDPHFAERLRHALLPPHALPAHEPSPWSTPPPPPPGVPPRPAASVPAALTPAERRKVWVLGVPQFLLAHVLLFVTSNLFQADLRSPASTALQCVILIASTGLAAYGVRLGYLHLRRTHTTPLVIATVLNALVLLVLLRGLAGAVMS
ncbi:hypothetical protein ACIQWR_05555 [Streptomyces sp. NPDC098789]|uniref:hypothetical protein n=1 Tax=Streptomyces sp. NPDC098789 TaxID=3366098 RepID=UPI003830F683